jgi:hypothetical protein
VIETALQNGMSLRLGLLRLIIFFFIFHIPYGVFAYPIKCLCVPYMMSTSTHGDTNIPRWIPPIEHAVVDTLQCQMSRIAPVACSGYEPWTYTYSWRAHLGLAKHDQLLATDRHEVSDKGERAWVGCQLRLPSQFTDSCHPDNGGAKFVRNFGSYNSHTA